MTLRATVYGLDGSIKRNVDVPQVFSTPFRPDVIHKAFNVQFTHHIQRQGRDPMAGMKTSAESWNTGRGVARPARIKGERHPRAGQVAGVANAVKGRQAHPPLAEKTVYRFINKKERRLALASAIAATSNRDLVRIRGHRVDKVPSLPLIVTDDLEDIAKARDLRPFFQKLGLEDDLKRVSKRVKHRSGKSPRRGRVKKIGKGPLFVLSKDNGLGKAIGSFPGLDYVAAKDLSVLHLAPGSQAGRLVIWTESALKELPKPVMEIGERIAI